MKHEEVDDIHRTGARCIPNSSLQDKKDKGTNYHVPFALRTKPGYLFIKKTHIVSLQMIKLIGRGDPTISMSCSDKIAKWLVVGIQGSLLKNFLKNPIYIDGIILSK